MVRLGLKIGGLVGLSGSRTFLVAPWGLTILDFHCMRIRHLLGALVAFVIGLCRGISKGMKI